RAERTWCEDVQRAVHEVLAYGVLLVIEVVAAVGDELQRLLRVEECSSRFLLHELHAERHERATGGAQAEVPPRAQLDMQRISGRIGARRCERALVILFLFGASILVDGFEIAGQRQWHRVDTRE